jgi:hypothetical protein
MEGHMSETLSLRESIYEKGYAPVGIDLGRSDLQTAMDRYLAFLELDEKFHSITQFELTGRGDGDFGQFRRTAGNEGVRGTVADNKDIFHFGSMTRQVVEARLSGALPHEMKEFLEAAEEIYWTGQRAKKQALEQLDYFEMGLVGVMQPERETINDVLRFIAYYPNKGNLAKGHFDRSTATLAIGESHEGLRITPGQNGFIIDADEAYMNSLDNKLQPVTHSEGEAKFFLGAGWNRLPDYLRVGNEDRPLAWHDVVESSTTVDEKVMRWAIVMFCNPHLGVHDYIVPSQPETRPYKQLGRLVVPKNVLATV